MCTEVAVCKIDGNYLFPEWPVGDLQGGCALANRPALTKPRKLQ